MISGILILARKKDGSKYHNLDICDPEIKESDLARWISNLDIGSAQCTIAILINRFKRA